MKYVLLLLGVAACGDSGGMSSTPDAQVNLSDSAASSDAAPVPHGLLVSWQAMPALPGPLKTDLSVTSATFRLSRLQVIGDNGQPMTSAPFSLTWSAETFGDPPTVGFAAAPGGLYSQVAIELDSAAGIPSFEIRGTVKVGAVTKPFYIHDTSDIDLDVTGYNVTFAPGTDATLPVRIDLKPPVESVDFEMVQDVNGTLDVGPADAQMGQLRGKLDDAFKRGS